MCVRKIKLGVKSMGRKNKYWKGWGTEFFHAIFGPPKKNKQHCDYDIKRMHRIAKQKQLQAYNKAKRFAKRLGY